MTDQDAMLSAIVENPDADLPRLAYADWLDDHQWDGSALRRPGRLFIEDGEIAWVPDRSIVAAKLGRISEMPPCDGNGVYHTNETRTWKDGGWKCSRCVDLKYIPIVVMPARVVAGAVADDAAPLTDRPESSEPAGD